MLRSISSWNYCGTYNLKTWHFSHLPPTVYCLRPCIEYNLFDHRCIAQTYILSPSCCWPCAAIGKMDEWWYYRNVFFSCWCPTDDHSWKFRCLKWTSKTLFIACFYLLIFFWNKLTFTMLKREIERNPTINHRHLKMYLIITLIIL